MRHFFEFEKYHTSYRQETVAGITTFLTMAYIIIVNPAILEQCGIFQFDKYHTSYRQETVAGITTFLTMAYIIIVNPAILENAGIPRGPQVTATILAAVLGTVIMARHRHGHHGFLGETAFCHCPLYE